MRERIIAVIVGAGLAGLVSGCDVHQFQINLRHALLAMMGRVPQVERKPAPISSAEQALRENAQLLREMFEVVLLREPYGPEELTPYLNTLGQGGSLEGIYNGLVFSERYHALESTHAPANPATVREFSRLVSAVQREIDRNKAKTRVFPTDLGVDAPFDSAQYERIYAQAPFFALKRILGTEAMKVVEGKLSDGKERAELAQWYSEWVAEVALQAAAMKVDFGLSLRNKPDVEFHRQWVNSLKPEVLSDRVIWEVLNRVHRILNAAEAAAPTQKPVRQPVAQPVAKKDPKA